MRLIYLAAPWKFRREAKGVADQLRAGGHQIVSRWHDEWADQSDLGVAPEVLCQEATMDLADVRASDVVLVLNWEKSEGKAVEQGYALALKIPVIIVGALSNVFHYLPTVYQANSLGAALDVLAGLP